MLHLWQLIFTDPQDGAQTPPCIVTSREMPGQIRTNHTKRNLLGHGCSATTVPKRTARPELKGSAPAKRCVVVHDVFKLC